VRAEDNLAPLCPNHHAVVERRKGTGGMTRAYSPLELHEYRRRRIESMAMPQPRQVVVMGNQKGVARGPLVTRLADIEDVYRATGSKVVLYSDGSDWKAPAHYRDKIAGIVTSASARSHLAIMATELGIPVISGLSLSEPADSRYPPVEVDAGPAASLRNITFDEAFILNAAKLYELEARIGSQVSVPPPLLNFVLRGAATATEQEFVAWARRWGTVEEVARFVLSLWAREDFGFARQIVTALCRDGAENEPQAYRWPVGRDNARRVLPQMVFWQRDSSLKLLIEWARSDILSLTKSACMALGSLVLLSWPEARELVERAFSHRELTVAKEVARLLPVLQEVDPRYAAALRNRCLQDPQLAPIAQSHPWGLVGINLTSLPALLLYSPELAFAEAERATNLILRFGLENMNLNFSRNSIAANLIPLWEVDSSRTLGIFRTLRPFLQLDEVQVDLLLAWAWLRQNQPQEADQVFTLIDGELEPAPRSLYRELAAAVSGP
jgi:phosphohistidine swiveling domain-containing protein